MPGATALLLVLLGQAATSVPPASNADFPRYDGAAWDLQRAGLMAKAATRSLRRAPDSLETLELLLTAGRTGEALGVLRRIVDRHPDRMAQGFKLVSGHRSADLHDDGLDHHIVLQQIVEAGFARAAALPREEAARARRQLMMVDTREPGMSFRDQLSSFVDKEKGTEAAALTEIDVLIQRPGKERVDALDAFIRAHTGDLLAARALHGKGQYLSSNSEVGVRDPTERLLTVVGIATELQSGRYAASEWVDRAPRLITGFSWYQPRFSPSNLRLVIDIFYEALKRHAGTFAPYDYGGPEDLVIRRFPELFELSGEGVAGVEQLIDRLERETGNRAGAGYLRVVLSLSRLNSRGYFYRGDRIEVSDSERAARTEAVTRSLDGLARGENRYARWALATLATFHFEQLDFSRARVRYREYLDRFGSSDYAWMASLRLGECAEGSGDLPAAIEAYRAAATRRGGNPVAAVMGRIAAARVFESQARFDRALTEYRRALASWDADFGREYLLVLNPGLVRSRADQLDLQLNVTQLEIRQRVERLAAAVASSSIALLERGRWFLEQRRWSEAAAEFDRFLSRHPQSPAIDAARHGAHVADLRQALDLVKSAGPGVDRALSLLRRIADGPYDNVVLLSKIAHASITWLQGATAEADAMMTSALAEWRSQPRARRAAAARTPLESDVAEIRELLFRPSAARPHLIVGSEVDVALVDGERVVVSNTRALPDFPNAVFLSDREIELLQATAMAFRTEETNPPREPMYRLRGWWQNFFDAGPQSWGNLPVETHPFMWRLEFTDRARTQATARVATSSSTGHAVALRKIRGIWQVIRTGRPWMS